MTESREIAFRRNEQLEAFLEGINIDLQVAENLLVAHYQQFSGMQYPLILVMGPLRSGTTLFTQWLANTGLVAYPTNLLSRFFKAPIVGAKIQLMLTDPRFNFRDELGEFVEKSGYCSENGKTKGVLAPNEFWYFWRRFLADPERDVWTDDELRQSFDAQTMLAELTGLMDVFHKPFAAKGMLFNYNIPFLDSILDKVIFVQIRRDPVTNIASVLDARKRQLGSEKNWYSFKIPEYEQLKKFDSITQVAGQIHLINKAVTKGLSAVSDGRKLVVDYEEFCGNPAYFFESLLGLLGESDRVYAGPECFEVSRNTSGLVHNQIIEALRRFESDGNE